MKILNNNRGVALIIAYSVMSILVALSAGFVLLTVTELSDARRYYNSTAAFWLAEAGINEFLVNTSRLNEVESQSFVYGDGTIELKKDDSQPTRRIITSVGVTRGSKRSIKLEYPANIPDVYNQSVSTSGDIAVTGNKATVLFNEKARVGGKITNTSKHSSLFFEDKKEGVEDSLVSLAYPDTNKNGIADEFDDFVQFNRDLVSTYPSNEVLYIKGNGTYILGPDTNLSGKKIVYVEGKQGSGDVVIQFNAGLEKDQNVTVISTGMVNYNQAGYASKDSQLNVIAWSGYKESAVLPGSHNGLIFTHGVATFDEIHDTSITNGGVIANGGISIREVWSTKTFNYADMRTDGSVPPGFEGLLGRGTSGYALRPDSWKEI